MGVHASAGNKALNYSLDFTGGTAMTVNFKDYLEVPGSDEDDLRKLFESEAGTTDIQFQNVSVHLKSLSRRLFLILSTVQLLRTP